MIVILEIVAAVCFVTAVFDMAGNGCQRADWAPWGVGVALAICALFA